ncbi:MAG: HDIG domain-containing protein [Kofleriaceae bacterium]
MTAPSAPRRPKVTWGLTIALAIGFALVVLPIVTADRWVGAIAGRVVAGEPAPLTVRVPPFAGLDTPDGRIAGGGGVVIARGDIATRDNVLMVAGIHEATTGGVAPYAVAFLALAAFGVLFSYHSRRSVLGRLVRVQIVNLALIAVLAAIVKIAMMVTPANVLIVPVVVLTLVPAFAIDRVTGLTAGILAALVTSLCVPFDAGIAVLLLVQVTVAGMVVEGRAGQSRGKPLVIAGLVTTLTSAIAYPLLQFLTSGRLPYGELSEPTRSAWVAVVVAPVIATAIALVLVPIYQWLVGEISRGRLLALESYAHPLIVKIQTKAPGTWQHSIMVQKLAVQAATEIGANARLAKVGADYRDLGKATAPKLYAENLEPGETPTDLTLDARWKHVEDGIAEARKAGLHERVIDFMYMRSESGVPPQNRETALVAICSAVEYASRSFKKVDQTKLDALVHQIMIDTLGRLDDSGLTTKDLRIVAASLREQLKHTYRDRLETPAASTAQTTGQTTNEAVAATVNASPKRTPPAVSHPPLDNELANSETAPIPLLEKQREIATTNRVSTRDLPKLDDGAVARSTRDSRREADRAAMAERYGVEPAGRDSGTNTSTFALAPEEVSQPSNPMSSRDGSLRPKLSQPSDGDSGELRSRNQRRTNDPETRQRASGDFVANMVLQPLASGSPTSLSDGDTGKHRQPRDSRREIDQFAQEAERALQIAAPDLDVLPPSAAGAVEVPPSIPPSRKPRESAEIEVQEVRSRVRAGTESGSPDTGARKRAATLPPIARPAPIKRAPTVPPPARYEDARLDPDRPAAKSTLFGGGASALRPPAAQLDSAASPRELTGPMPQLGTRTNPAVPRGVDLDAMRDEAARNRDDAATTQPSMIAVRASDLRDVGEFNRRHADAAVTSPIQKQDDPDASRTNPAMPRALAENDAASTQPAMESVDSIGDDTSPAIELPLPAPAFSDPAIELDKLKESAAKPQNTWARGLAARVDAEMDTEFGRDTPTRAPSRAELQALVDVPPDATRQQSVEEIERLAMDPANRRSEDELRFTPPPRRGPYPTAEVSEEDIEAAIEIVPSARRTGSIPIGVAKKKPTQE